MNPRVSIGIPAYNAARYLQAAVTSALGQSFEDIEVVVCDNQSTDESESLCSRIEDPRFRYVRFEDHVGQPGNWNRCVRESRGEFVVLLHADDLLEAAFVDRALEALGRSPKAAFVHSAVRHIAEDGRFLFLQRLHEHDHETTGDAFFLRLLREGCLVNPAGLMVRRAAYEAAGPFFEDVAWGTDWDMWLRLSRIGSVVSLAEPLASYRQHGSSGTAAMVASGRNGRDELRVIDHLLPEGSSDEAPSAGLRREAIERAAHRTWCWAEEACRTGHPRASRRGVIEAVRMNPNLIGASRVWALFLASFFGYGLFERLRGAKRAIAG